jgi:hypothetical protein
MRVSKIVSFSIVILLITVAFAGAVSIPITAQRDNVAHVGDYSPAIAAQPGTGSWNITTVGWGGGPTSLALDSSGYPHISYYEQINGPNETLNYAYQDASGWHFTSLGSGDGFGASGQYTSIALDSSGYPHIIFYEPETLVYFYQDAAGWHETVVASGGVASLDEVGMFPSLALDASGYPHISYSDDNYTNGSNFTINYAYEDVSGWHYATVDNVGMYGGYTSIALDASGYPHISYYNSSSNSVNGTLNYAYQDAAGWHITTVDSVNMYLSGSGDTSLALDTSGYPHISYYDSDGNLKYAYQDAAGWHITTVDSSPILLGGMYSSIALDTSGSPHIGYSGAAYTLKYAYWIPLPSLTVTAPLAVVVNQNFTVSGTLSAGMADIAHATITLQRSTNNATWTNVTTTVTNANGNYQFSKNESAVGTYFYRTTYAGNDTYGNATSNAVNVTVSMVPITVAGAPAVSAQNANSLDLFVRGSDNALWYKYWTGTTWTTATSLGGNLSSAPAATSTANGVMDVFVQGADNGLWYKTTTNNGTTWSGWNSLGGSLTSSPAVTSSNGVIDVFVRGTDNALWWKTTTNNGASWSGWMPVGGQLAAGTGPAADARGTNSLDVFVQGTDHAVWYSHWNGATWSAWKSLGGSLTSSPAATSSGTGQVDVFVRGTDNALWYKTTTNSGASWSGWKSLGGALTSSPGVTSPANGVMDVFVLGTGNGLWWQTTTNRGASWSGWMSADGI